MSNGHYAQEGANLVLRKLFSWSVRTKKRKKIPAPYFYPTFPSEDQCLQAISKSKELLLYAIELFRRKNLRKINPERKQELTPKNSKAIFAYFEISVDKCLPFT